MIPGVAIAVIVSVLAVANVATMVWIGMLQGKLRASDQGVAAARQDMDAMQHASQDVAFAKILLQTESAAGTDVQAAINRLTAAFTEQLQASLLHIAGQMERGLSQVLGQHLEVLASLREAAIKQMEEDAGQLLSQHQETLTRLREAAVKPLSVINDLADEQQASLSQQLVDENKRHEVHQGKLIAKFDAKLSDVISNYLMETLGNAVDLGAQGPYLFRMLEEHKSELKREILDGA